MNEYLKNKEFRLALIALAIFLLILIGALLLAVCNPVSDQDELIFLKETPYISENQTSFTF